MTRFVISSRIGAERIPHFIGRDEVLGQAHYSWKIIARMYRDALRNMGMEVCEIEAPDIYQSDLAKGIAGISGDEISLIVKPTEFIRPCFGLRNIAICGWEFPEFSDVSHHGDPRTNQIAMLKSVDEVWCWSGFTAANLRKLGVDARRLPPPVMSFAGTDSESISDVPCVALDTINGFDAATCRSETIPYDEVKAPAGQRFLSVINPWDKRKQIATLLQAATASMGKGDQLLVKLIIDNEGTVVENINAILSIHHELRLVSSNVIFIGQNLTKGQMNQLYQSADFYISATSAEGLNLPLIEAMHQGVIGITTEATAMADYIDSDNAVVIPASRVATGPDFHSASSYLRTSHFPPTRKSVEAAIRKASALTDRQRNKLQSHARSRVATLFGSEHFATEVRSAI